MDELKLQTPVDAGRSRLGVSLADRMMVLGSCFADSIGGKMAELGFDVCVNPFGTLYNPVSLCNSIARLDSGIPFAEKDCVPMGAGAGLYCSFSHHTSFARRTPEEFLADANSALEKASKAWKAADKVIITLGTAWCFTHIPSGEIVSNCLKVDGKLFSRKRLSVSETALLLSGTVARYPGKEFIFTVSPIRHMKDGAHGNQLSKSTLLLAVDEVISRFPDRTDYFPAYEIVLDELRDYRFYSEDMVHPSKQTVDYLWSRFISWALPEDEIPEIEVRKKAFLRSQHRVLHE